MIVNCLLRGFAIYMYIYTWYMIHIYFFCWIKAFSLFSVSLFQNKGHAHYYNIYYIIMILFHHSQICDKRYSNTLFKPPESIHQWSIGTMAVKWVHRRVSANILVKNLHTSSLTVDSTDIKVWSTIFCIIMFSISSVSRHGW